MNHTEKTPDPASATRNAPWMKPGYQPGLVSVIIPTYNRANLVIEAMDSVAKQSYRPIELIVVDDGSTDNTRASIQEWSKTCEDDEEFELCYLRQENSGAPAARNNGAGASSGEFVLWHDSDDLMSDGRVGWAVEKLNRTGADACLCGFTSKGRKYRPSSYMPDDMLRDGLDAFLSDDLYYSTIIWTFRRRSLITADPWKEYLVRHQDQYFLESYLLREDAPTVTSVSEYLCFIRSGDSGIYLTRRDSYDDYAGQLRYFETMLENLQRRGVDRRVIREVTRHAAREAVHSYRSFPGMSSRFMDLVDEYDPRVNWSADNPVRRTLWRLGGRSWCNLWLRFVRWVREWSGI